MTLQERIQKVVEFKCGGNENEFARLCGISPLTVRTVCRQGTNSVNLIAAIVAAVDEINPKWLLTGQGNMLYPFALAYAEAEYVQGVANMFKLATLLPKMSIEQQRRFIFAAKNGTKPDFTPTEIEKLKR